LNGITSAALAEALGGITVEALKPLMFRASRAAESRLRIKRESFYDAYVRTLKTNTSSVAGLAGNRPSALSAYNILPRGVSISEVNAALQTPTAFGLIRQLAALNIIGSGNFDKQRARDASRERLYSSIVNYLADALKITHVVPEGDEEGDGLSSRRYMEQDVFMKFTIVIADILDRYSKAVAEYLVSKSRDSQDAISWAQVTLSFAVLESIDRYASIVAEQYAPTAAERNQWLDSYRSLFTAVHARITLPDLDRRTSVPYEELYVQPTLHSETGGRIKLLPLLETLDRSVILGDPGAGKSTASQVLAMICLKAGRLIPFILPMRDVEVSSGFSVVDEIRRRLSTVYQLDCNPILIEQLLTEGAAVLIFDGLDELIDTSTRTRASQAIETACVRYPLAPVVVTCRHVGYSQSKLRSDIFVEYSIQPFDEEDVQSYVTNWFSAAQEAVRQDGPSGREASNVKRPTQRIQDFMDSSTSISDLRSNPLLLSFICVLYRGRKYIPANRPELFAKCVDLLVRTWDSSRGLDRAAASDIYELALAEVAEFITSKAEFGDGIPEGELREVLCGHLTRDAGYPDALARQTANGMIEHCRGRAWIFTDVGLPAEGERRYAFTHSTFKEYFYAWSLTRKTNSTRELANSLFSLLRKGKSQVAVQVAVHLYDLREHNGGSRCVASLLSHFRDDNVLGSEARGALDVIFDAVDAVYLRRDALILLCRELLRQIVGPVNRPASDLHMIFSRDFRHYALLENVYVKAIQSILDEASNNALLRLCWLVTNSSSYLPKSVDWQELAGKIEQLDCKGGFESSIRCYKRQSHLAWQLALRRGFLEISDIRPDSGEFSRGLVASIFESCGDTVARIGDDTAAVWAIRVIGSPLRRSRWLPSAMALLRLLGEYVDPQTLHSLQLPEMWMVSLRLQLRSLLENGTFENVVSRCAGYDPLVRQGVGYLVLACLDLFTDLRPSLAHPPPKYPAEVQISTDTYEDIYNKIYRSLFAGSQDLSASFKIYLRSWAPGVIWEAEGSQIGPEA
jgi:hypothetical protein